jgi:hypothetical protein
MNTIQLVQINTNDLMSLISNVIKNEFNNLKPLITESSSDDEEYLTREETAKFLKVSLTTINQWQSSGIIKRYKLGNKNFYKKSELLSKISESNTTNN